MRITAELSAMKSNFSISNIDYKAKKDSRDYLCLEVTIDSEHEHLEDIEEFNIGKAGRYFNEDSLNKEKLRSEISKQLDVRCERREKRAKGELRSHKSYDADADIEKVKDISGVNVVEE